jgi:hypothetical protein
VQRTDVTEDQGYWRLNLDQSVEIKQHHTQRIQKKKQEAADSANDSAIDYQSKSYQALARSCGSLVRKTGGSRLFDLRSFIYWPKFPPLGGFASEQSSEKAAVAPTDIKVECGGLRGMTIG